MNTKTAKILLKLVGLILASMTMFATMPASAASTKDAKKKSEQAVKTQVKEAHVAGQSAAEPKERSFGMRLDEFYDDLQLPDRN